MNSRYRPPVNLPPPSSKSTSKSSGNTPGKPNEPNKPADDNALWRIQDWFTDLSPDILAKLKLYHSELLRFNLKVNLISRATERDADESHFADCIMAARIVLSAGLDSKVYDIGSGNGLPGLILAILEPRLHFVLVESDGRKCEFLKHVIQVTGLSNASVLNVRFETLVGQGVTCAVSRGFASISKTVLACNKIFNKGGRFFHLKGNNWSSEIVELPSQLISVWGPNLLGEYTLPVSQARRAVVVTQKKI